MTFTAEQLAQKLSGEVIGDGATPLTGFSSAERAAAGDIIFAEKERYMAAAEASGASAILISGPSVPSKKVLIRVANARVAAAKALALFYPDEPHPGGTHASAVVDPSARVDPSAFVGPHSVIGPGAKVGARARLLGGNHVGRGAELGDDTTLHPHVVVYPHSVIGNRVTIHAGTVIGSDGYGYVFDQGRHVKMPQVGRVVIGDDVEIGANTAIDRGALGPTTIGPGTKIDNLVHIAHNVTVGAHCLIMGQVGFAGSTQLGDYGVIASQSGIAGHLTLGKQCVVGAKSGVMRDVEDKQTVLGIPAAPDKQAKRQWIAVQMLPELIQRVRELERELETLRIR
jgi:UDP-3-O-[3-hydroxymyristoyl] glucosamine N-acyltransferase